MIYAVEVLDSKFIKIGFSDSDDIGIRIASLQTGCPFEIRPLLTIAGTLRQEKALHSSLRMAFARVRIPMPPNEWYPGLNPVFQGFIADLRLGFSAGLSNIEKYNTAIKQPGAKNNCYEPNIKWPKLKII